MGVMDWQPFIPALQAALDFGQDWERIEAVRALARMSHPEVREILEAARHDPEPAVRNAVREALEAVDARRLP
jgi:HEAT repeat protein